MKAQLTLSSIDNIIRIVEKKYGMSIISHKIIRNMKNRYLILLQTKTKKYILKKPLTPFSGMPFLVESQLYLSEQGIPQPQMIADRDGQYCFEFNNHLHILYEYIDGELSFKLDNKRILDGIKLMAHFHRKSLSFRPRAHLSRFSKVSDWRNEYAEKLDYMKKWWLKEKKRTNKDIRKKIMIKDCPFFIKKAEKMIDRFNKIDPIDWKSNLTAPFLSHGDFTPENVLWTQDGIFLIDLDNISYQYPSKDFSRYLMRVSLEKQKWSSALFHDMFHLYSRTNPLNSAQIKLFLLDLIFPHQFERLIRKKVYKKMSTQKLKQFMKNEVEKTEYAYKLLA